MRERPLLSDFEPHVGSSFRLNMDVENLSLDIVLVGAQELRSGPQADLPDASFSLLFCGPLEHELPQMIRHLEHPEIGDMDLFLVPVQEDEEGRYYEAIFNYAC